MPKYLQKIKKIDQEYDLVCEMQMQEQSIKIPASR